MRFIENLRNKALLHEQRAAAFYQEADVAIVQGNVRQAIESTAGATPSRAFHLLLSGVADMIDPRSTSKNILGGCGKALLGALHLSPGGFVQMVEAGIEASRFPKI